MTRLPHGPLLCSPEQKAQLEAENAVEQIDYITALVVGDYKVFQLRETHIRELQRLAVKKIYPCGGSYRDARDEITISDGDHRPAHPADVQNLVTELVEWVNHERATGRHEVECAAFTLWRLNWIHPFRGGNGRTSRMIAYLIIAMGLGHMPPGTPSIPALIYERRDAYIDALRTVDNSLKAQLDADVQDPSPDCRAIVEFLQPLVEQQMTAGARNAEMFDRMIEALANGTGRVELDLPEKHPASTVPLSNEIEDSRQATIKRGTRLASLYLLESEKRLRVNVSNEQALKLLELGARWNGPAHYRPAK